MVYVHLLHPMERGGYICVTTCDTEVVSVCVQSTPYLHGHTTRSNPS